MFLDQKTFLDLAIIYTDNAPENIVSPDQDLSPHLSGLRIFDCPLIGFAASDDYCIASLQSNEKADIDLAPPTFWLSTAKTVVSFFFPFTLEIRRSNRIDMRNPSAEWLHGRIEGQNFIVGFCYYMADLLQQAGHETVIPAVDSRFLTKRWFGESGRMLYSSNWSERHIAYACGLGTFSLSKNIITKAGSAGRCGSLVTSMEFVPTLRSYTGTDDYCNRCGTCVRNCPASAISLQNGKEHIFCSEFLDNVKNDYNPYYGCGKCQVAVPCEDHIPKIF